MLDALSGREGRARVLWLGTLAVLLALEWRAISAIPVHHDIAWPLYLAQRILGGARLYVDVVEVHPPLAIWLATVAEVIARGLSLSDIAVHHFLALGAVAASVLVSAPLLRRIVPDGPWTRAALLALQGFLLLPLVGWGVGQEEHLMLALVWPYFLAAALALRGERTGRIGWLVGAMAAIGFALKPLYVAVWLVVEGSVLVRNRRADWRRPEPLAVVAGGALYVAGIAAFTPAFLRVAGWVGRLYRYYYPGSFWGVVLMPQTALVLGAVLADRLAPAGRLGPLRRIGTVALAVCTILVYAQEKGWTYHWYPAVALAIYVLALAGLDTLRDERVARAAARVPAGLAAALLAAGLLAGGAGVMARTRAERDSLDFGPYFLVEMERVVRTYGNGGPLMTLSSVLQSAFPLVTYTGVPFASRFSCLWMLPGLYADQWGKSQGRWFPYHDAAHTSSLERYLIDAVIEDMQRARPSLLVVERRSPSEMLPSFDYLVYFARDARFREILSHYTVLGNVDKYLILRRTR